MEFQQLVTIMKDNGISGAGGAGFPSYAKLDRRADTIILNCAECEPLLKVHRQVLAKYALEIMRALSLIAETVGAKRALVAVKATYRETVEAVEANLASFPMIELRLLPEIYPSGDETVLIYETTGRVVQPGALPITVGATVFNVETVLNVYRAVFANVPVTEKYITVGGAVRNSATLHVPLGISYRELAELAGGTDIPDPVYFAGGPMTGRIVSGYDTVTKTSNALLVLPRGNYVIQKRLSKPTMDMKRAMSACCQCEMCTDLCPRHLLGHPIEPHKFMRMATSGVTKDVAPFINTFFCCQCGLCEMYACGQELKPATLIAAYKNGLKSHGITPPKVSAGPVRPERESRRVPKARLITRLGLDRYNVAAPLQDQLVSAQEVKILLRQHIGAPAEAVVQVGDRVETGQVIATVPPDKLGVPVHASISGVVADVNGESITVRA